MVEFFLLGMFFSIAEKAIHVGSFMCLQGSTRACQNIATLINIRELMHNPPP